MEQHSLELEEDKEEKQTYKKYSLYTPIPLTNTDGYLLNNFLVKRTSSLSTLETNKVTGEDMAYLLRCGYGLQNLNEKQERKEHRTVPSAGKKYPLEVYVFVLNDTEAYKPGVYHYGVEAHVMEPVMLCQFTKEDIEKITPVKSLHGAQGFICITGVALRTVQKYGDRGYRYVLLEAGHVAQNIILAGVERNICVVPMGGVNDLEIEAVLGLNDQEERVLYTLFF